MKPVIHPEEANKPEPQRPVSAGFSMRRVSLSRDRAARSPDTVSITKRKKLSKRSVGPPIPTNLVEDLPARREQFQPLTLSIHLPGNRLSGLPGFSNVDLTRLGETDKPAEPKMPVPEKDHVQSLSQPVISSAASMVGERRLDYWQKRKASTDTTSRSSAFEGLSSHPVDSPARGSRGDDHAAAAAATTTTQATSSGKDNAGSRLPSRWSSSSPMPPSKPRRRAKSASGEKPRIVPDFEHYPLPKLDLSFFQSDARSPLSIQAPQNDSSERKESPSPTSNLSSPPPPPIQSAQNSTRVADCLSSPLSIRSQRPTALDVDVSPDMFYPPEISPVPDYHQFLRSQSQSRSRPTGSSSNNNKQAGMQRGEQQQRQELHGAPPSHAYRTKGRSASSSSPRRTSPSPSASATGSAASSVDSDTPPSMTRSSTTFASTVSNSPIVNKHGYGGYSHNYSHSRGVSLSHGSGHGHSGSRTRSATLRSVGKQVTVVSEEASPSLMAASAAAARRGTVSFARPGEEDDDGDDLVLDLDSPSSFTATTKTNTHAPHSPRSHNYSQSYSHGRSTSTSPSPSPSPSQSPSRSPNYSYALNGIDPRRQASANLNLYDHPYARYGLPSLTTANKNRSGSSGSRPISPLLAANSSVSVALQPPEPAITSTAPASMKKHDDRAGMGEMF